MVVVEPFPFCLFLCVYMYTYSIILGKYKIVWLLKASSYSLEVICEQSSIAKQVFTEKGTESFWHVLGMV